jgi:hypothetical protein
MYRRELLRILPLTAMVVFSLEGSSAPETTITVKLTNQFDKPVENAYVILDFLGDHKATKLGKREKLHWEVRSNLQGTTHFPSIRQGKIRLQVIAEGYQTYGQVMDIDTEEKTIELKLLPPQKQYSVHGDMPASKPANPAPAEKPKDPPPQP